MDTLRFLLQYLCFLLFSLQNEIQLKGIEFKRKKLQKSFKKAPQYFLLGKDWQINGTKFITLGKGFQAGCHLRIEALTHVNGVDYSPKLEISDGVSIGDFCHIACAEKIVIGENTLMGSKVFITDHFHGHINKEESTLPPGARPLSCKPVHIGNNVWIGDNVSVMPGVTIGDNVIIGANTVVTHSFSSDTVIAGCPARILRNL